MRIPCTPSSHLCAPSTHRSKDQFATAQSIPNTKAAPLEVERCLPMGKSYTSAQSSYPMQQKTQEMGLILSETQIAFLHSKRRRLVSAQVKIPLFEVALSAVGSVHRSQTKSL